MLAEIDPEADNLQNNMSIKYRLFNSFPGWPKDSHEKFCSFFLWTRYTFSPHCNKYVNTFGAIITLVNVRISMKKSRELSRSLLKCRVLGAVGLTQLLWATTDYKTPTSSPCLCHEFHFSLLAFSFGVLCRSESRRKRFAMTLLMKAWSSELYWSLSWSFVNWAKQLSKRIPPLCKISRHFRKKT